MICVGILFITARTRKWPFTEACHLFTDNPDEIEELHQFAEKLGLQGRWFQNHSALPHYDLTRNKRYLAVKKGAVEMSREKEAEIIRKYREHGCR